MISDLHLAMGIVASVYSLELLGCWRTLKMLPIFAQLRPISKVVLNRLHLFLTL